MFIITQKLSLASVNGVTQWIREGAAKGGAPPGTQDDSAKTSYRNILRIGEVKKDPWGLAFKIVTKRLVTRRKTPSLDNPDRVKYIVRSLFPHVEPFQRQERSSCVVRREELFTLEELKRAGGRLKTNTAPGIDGLPNEILKEVIGVLHPA